MLAEAEGHASQRYYSVVSIAFPLVCVVSIFMQAAIMKFDTFVLISKTAVSLIYPYLFVNLEIQGIGGVAKWIAMLFMVFWRYGMDIYF